jgi:hypothetical protein
VGESPPTFSEWLLSFEWLGQRDLPCVISADLDGLACGLLQSSLLNWRVVGTYDGAALCLIESPDRLPWDEVVFIDVEILRTRARSIGNHLLAEDGADSARIASALPQCVNPNLWRAVNVVESFQRKYPFSTLPLLLASHAARGAMTSFADPWLALSLHTDSSLTNAAVYQDNALDWLGAMGAGASPEGLRKLCELLRRLPMQSALRLVNQVQGWASEAGFGKLQRACRFDLRSPESLARAMSLLGILRRETGAAEGGLVRLTAPAHTVEFETRKLPIHTKGRRAASFAEARRVRALSLAATGQTEEGLSLTVPPGKPAFRHLD